MSNVHDVMPPAKKVLSIDLGKFKSVACVLDVAAGTHWFETIPTNPAAVHDLLVAVGPCRLVIEACSVAGWVHDLAVALSIRVQVANTNGEAWQYKRVKRKTDRDDALKLTKLSLLNELPVVHMPPPATRGRPRHWRVIHPCRVAADCNGVQIRLPPPATGCFELRPRLQAYTNHGTCRKSPLDTVRATQSCPRQQQCTRRRPPKLAG